MANQSFSWKSLFVNEDPNTTSKPEQPVSTPSPSKTTSENKFPETTFNTAPVNANPINTTSFSNNPFVNEVLDVYQKGFDGLNVEGFDFFELYKSVQAVGVSNPQSYQMAFTMGKTIQPNLTKEFLIEKAKFYIDEIEKVYIKYDATGNSKNKTLSDNITAQKNDLTKSINDLETQIAQLQNELETKKAALSKIDVENQQMFTEIQLKIEANNMAKQKIVESINTVVTGINQYL